MELPRKVAVFRPGAKMLCWMPEQLGASHRRRSRRLCDFFVGIWNIGCRRCGSRAAGLHCGFRGNWTLHTLMRPSQGLLAVA